jgi:hypothetical protein
MSPGTLAVVEHVRDPDGAVSLTLRLTGPLIDDPTVVLAGCGGLVTLDGDDALIAWTWPPAMVPPNPPEICAGHVRQLMTAWAAQIAQPQGLVLTDPGTVIP